MTIRFNSYQLMLDFDAYRKQKKISLNKAANRAEVQPSTIIGMRSGKVQDITVTTLARMLHFMNETDINIYIYDDGE